LDTLTQLGHLSSALSSQQEGIENGFHKLVACLAYHKNRLDVLIVGVGLLNKKTKDILSMVSRNSRDSDVVSAADTMQSTLGLNYSMTSQMVSANEQLLHLANKNFDDNATVKVVTFLTLLYLPASLVSVRTILKSRKPAPHCWYTDGFQLCNLF
jgi:hypothetical protein